MPNISFPVFTSSLESLNFNSSSQAQRNKKQGVKAMGINFIINTTYKPLPEDNLYRCTIELKILTLAGSDMGLQDLILSNRVVMNEKLHKFWGYFEGDYRIRVTHHDSEKLEDLVLLVMEIKEELRDTLNQIVRLNRYNSYLCSTHDSTERFTID